VTKEVMNVFKGYAGDKIERRAVQGSNGKKVVEIYKLVVIHTLKIV